MLRNKTNRPGFFNKLIAGLQSQPDNRGERHAIEKMNTIAFSLFPNIYAQYYVDNEGYLMSDILADEQHNKVIEEIRGADVAVQTGSVAL